LFFFFGGWGLGLGALGLGARGEDILDQANTQL
jgi:hypothetical protein